MSTWLTSYGGGAVVTPSDTTQINFRALYIGSAGNVTVIAESGESILFTAPPIGTIIPIRGQKVMATGTTVATLVALR